MCLDAKIETIRRSIMQEEMLSSGMHASSDDILNLILLPMMNVKNDKVDYMSLWRCDCNFM